MRGGTVKSEPDRRGSIADDEIGSGQKQGGTEQLAGVDRVERAGVPAAGPADKLERRSDSDYARNRAGDVDIDGESGPDPVRY